MWIHKYIVICALCIIYYIGRRIIHDLRPPVAVVNTVFHFEHFNYETSESWEDLKFEPNFSSDRLRGGSNAFVDRSPQVTRRTS